MGFCCQDDSFGRRWPRQLGYHFRRHPSAHQPHSAPGQLQGRWDLAAAAGRERPKPCYGDDFGPKLCQRDGESRRQPCSRASPVRAHPDGTPAYPVYCSTKAAATATPWPGPQPQRQPRFRPWWPLRTWLQPRPRPWPRQQPRLQLYCHSSGHSRSSSHSVGHGELKRIA